MTSSRYPLLDPHSLVLNRRALLKASVVLGAGAMFGSTSKANQSGALSAGEFRLSSFSDGYLTLPSTNLAPKADAEERQQAMKLAGQQGEQYESPLNVTLVETDSEKILIDVGSGSRFMASAGQLASSLEEAGIDPGSITKVVYTHAHPDHIWGTIDDFDELSFPDAEHHISEAEWNFWMSKDVLTKLPEAQHAFAVGAQRNLEAIKDQIKMLKPGDDIITGISVLDTAGHTPGHISLEIGTGNDRIVILGDALTHPVIAFQHPDWQPATDIEPDKAVATRKKLLDRLETEGNRIIGYHLPAPGTGRVAKKAGGYSYEPLSQ